MKSQCTVTHVVVGTISAVTMMYMLTLAVCCIFKIDPSDKLLAALKDAGLVALGAIGSILARTRPDVPADVNVVNPPSDPVQTQEQNPLDSEG